MESTFDDWMDAYQVACSADLALVPCPECRANELRLVFVVDTFEAESGTAAFWCDACLTGLGPNRALVPASSRRVLRDAGDVPNYRLAP